MKIISSYSVEYRNLFNVETFKKNPTPFMSFLKKKTSGVKPTKAHYFSKLLEDKGLLARTYTENVDGLEIAAGVSEELVFQVYGMLAFFKAYFQRSRDNVFLIIFSML